MWVPGMPAQSRVLSLPYILYERKGEEHTAHARTSCRQPAAKDKQRDLDLAHSLIALKAVPRDGGDRYDVKAPSLAELALAIGYRCAESACRLLGRAGKKLIKVTGTRGRNEYEWLIPEKPKSSRTYRAKDFQAASARDAVKNPEFAKYLPDDTSKLSEVNFVKFSEIAHHRRSPLTRSERAVFDFLTESGIFVWSEREKRWKSGVVNGISQEFIGSRLGRHRDTVRRALRHLAEKWTDRKGEVHRGRGIIKMIGKPGAWMKHGAEVPKGTPGAIWQQDEPNEYIGICEWAETEKERYERAMEVLRATHNEWVAVMDSIFKATRLEWLEERRETTEFQFECWRRMAKAGVDDKTLELVFARPPN